MIGLALITFVAILGASLRTSFGDAVDKLFVADYALTASNGFDPFTKEADAAVAVTPGVKAVSPLRLCLRSNTPRQPSAESSFETTRARVRVSRGLL